eukprot:1311777-Alexandrium_andersonii.AAC.1
MEGVKLPTLGSEELKGSPNKRKAEDDKLDADLKKPRVATAVPVAPDLVPSATVDAMGVELVRCVLPPAKQANLTLEVRSGPVCFLMNRSAEAVTVKKGQ